MADQEVAGYNESRVDEASRASGSGLENINACIGDEYTSR